MVNPVKVQLLYFPGCPNVAATRIALSQALENLSLGSTTIEEVNVHDPKTLNNLKNYPSPSILINGRDIEGFEPTDATACRIYDGKGGVPREEIIIQAIGKILE